MKEIFQRKIFWMILIILLLVVFAYPPFIAKVPSPNIGKGEVIIGRSWGWIFSPPKYAGMFIMEPDLKMLLAETVIATLLTIGICLVPFKKLS